MRSASYSLNPFWWLQFHLLGGFGKLLPFTIAYTGLLIAGAVGFWYLFRGIGLAAYCDRAIVALAVIQLLLLVPGGCNAVFRALSRDITARMLESHRLTPCGSASVVFGYVFGANLQILMMYAIGVVVGVVTIRWGTIGTANWLVGNVYMLLLAPMLWSLTVLMGVGRPKPINPNTLLFLMFMFSTALVTFPGFGLLSGVYAGYVGWSMMTGSKVGSPALVMIPLVAALFVGGIFARGAMWKYRRPDLPAFGTYRSMVLYVIILAANTLGLLLPLPDQVAHMGVITPREPDYIPLCMIITSGAALIVAAIPLYAAAHERCRSLCVSFVAEARVTRRVGGVPILCSALLVAFVVPFKHDVSATQIVLLLAVVWCSLVAMEGLLLRALSRPRRRYLMLALYMIFVWGVSPLADLWYGELTAVSARDYEEPERTMVFGFSPIGAIATVFLDLDVDCRLGLVFQFVVASICWGLSRQALRKARHRRMALGMTDK